VLGRDAGDFLVELLGDLDEASAVNLAEPLEVPELCSELEQSSHDFLHLILVESSYNIRDAAVAVVKKVEATARLSILFVVKGVDILEIAVEGKEQFCRVELGDRVQPLGDVDEMRSTGGSAHLLGPLPLHYEPSQQRP